jgi:hypothetical protein
MGENRNANTLFVRNHLRKRPLGRHGARWENNIKLYLKEIGWKDVD